MSDWILVPCLVTLRGEFNAVNPTRDKGADGSIGDSAHTSASDHTPDEDSDILRDHDADSKNEVHALDIDSSGPWPDAGWFNRAILAIVERHRTGADNRLQYVIWNGRIASRSWGWTWRAYSGADPHTNHAHFSSRYTTAQESDTRPFGVASKGLADMDLDELLWEKGSEPDSWKNRYGTQPATVRNAIAFAAYDSTDAEKLANTIRTDISGARSDLTMVRSELAELKAALAGIGQGGGGAPADVEAIAQRTADILRDRLQS